MILAFINDIESSESVLKTTFELARGLKKDFGVLLFVQNEQEQVSKQSEIESFLQSKTRKPDKLLVLTDNPSQLVSICEENEAAFLFIQWNEKDKKELKKHLRHCRDLRIPYVFYKNSFDVINLKKVLLPVGFLIEEYEKAQFASAFGRFFHAEITILLANDYGSKAARTAEKMKELFDKFQLNYSEQKAKSDSFKLDKEAVKLGERELFDVLLISTSRDYGPDDMLFGPKEYHLVKKSSIPLLLVNPRGDLYTLCD